ncbi:hypothetical protein PR202_ga18475 [Eleusine coracana subsp. coracana]|uniref:Uncharacterized protein n=1 Tax=Eleusine coracana subsp. coracana TaxID=191504 RepID=A0AAV5CRX1_ELECO|nr:hypothetical protein PR202_ga18475 [Eleusine coracana subsp. coracana]
MRMEQWQTYLSAGEEEDEVVVEVRELAIMLELLPDAGLVGVGRDMRLQEGADLAEPLLLRLPHRRRRHRVTGGGERASARRGRRRRRRRLRKEESAKLKETGPNPKYPKTGGG